MDEALAKIDALKEGEDSKPVSGMMSRIMWQSGMKDDYVSWIRQQYKFFAYVHWDGWTGWTFPSPVSDGTYIYQWIGQGQIVCYDLAGNRKWATHFPYDPEGTPQRGDGVLHLPSPMLAGDVFVVQTNDYLIGVDKHNGKVLWRVPNRVNHFGVGSHKGLKLDDGTHVIVCTSGKIVRARDGRQVGDLGVQLATGAVSGGDSLPGVGNMVAIPAHRANEVVAFKLISTGKDTVEAQRAWTVPGGSVNTSPILSGGYLYRIKAPKDGTGNVIEWATGKLLPDPVAFTIPEGGVGPILAGKDLFWFENGTAYGRKRSDGRLVVECQVLELTGPGKAVIKSSGNLLDGSERPDMVRFRRYNPDYWKARQWDPQGGVPGQFANGGFCAAGNRLFLRQLSSVYCFGNPDEPYSWNPGSRPESVTRLLEANRRASAAEAQLERLALPYRWERSEAVKAIAALPGDQQKKLVPVIGNLLLDESWFTAKSAALAIQEIGPGGGAEAPVLAAIRAAFGTRDRLRSTIMVETLLNIAPERAADVIPDIERLFAAGDTGFRDGGLSCVEADRSAGGAARVEVDRGSGRRGFGDGHGGGEGVGSYGEGGRTGGGVHGRGADGVGCAGGGRLS